MAGQEIRLETRDVGDATVVEIVADRETDEGDDERIAAGMADLLARARLRLVLDGRRIAHPLGVAGWTSFFEDLQRVRRAGGDIILAAPSDAACSDVEPMGLTERVRVAPDVDTAVAWLSEEPGVPDPARLGPKLVVASSTEGGVSVLAFEGCLDGAEPETIAKDALRHVSTGLLAIDCARLMWAEPASFEEFLELARGRADVVLVEPWGMVEMAAMLVAGPVARFESLPDALAALSEPEGCEIVRPEGDVGDAVAALTERIGAVTASTPPPDQVIVDLRAIDGGDGAILDLLRGLAPFLAGTGARLAVVGAGARVEAGLDALTDGVVRGASIADVLDQLGS